MKKIDFRCRLYSDKWNCDSALYDAEVSRRVERYGGTTSMELPISLDEFVRELDKHEIAIAVMPGRDAEACYGVKVSNDHLAELASKYPGRLVAFAGVDPNKRMDAVREIDRSVKELGLKGVAIDPQIHHLSHDDRRYYPIYAKCVELDIPIITLAGISIHLKPRDFPAWCSHPSHVDVVACDFPELKIVITHAGHPWFTEVRYILARHPNVYVEFHSPILINEELVKAANTFAQDQILYSSAYPWGKLDSYKMLEEAKIFSDEVMPKLMYENAARLLKLRS